MRAGQQTRVLSWVLLFLSGADGEYLHSKELHDDFLLRWNITEDAIQVKIQAKATGWAGFGIAEAGGMRGADIVYYEADSGELTDAYAINNAQPLVDACQDWVLVSASRNDEYLIVEAWRKLETGDTQDWELVDDSKSAKGHLFLAAWGDSKAISFHASKRSKGTVFLFAKNQRQERKQILHRTKGLKHVDIVQKGVVLPPRKNFYHSHCENLAKALGESKDPNPRDIVAHEAVLSGRGSHLVHHFTIDVFDRENCGGQRARVLNWVPGMGLSVMPPNVGLRLFGPTGRKSLFIQTHYFNPEEKEGLKDSSGVRLYLTKELRKHDMGMMQIGDSDVKLAGRALPRGWSKASYRCKGLTDDFEDAKVHVYMRHLHMHFAGQRMEVRTIRDGKVVHTAKIEMYDFDQAEAHDPVDSWNGGEGHIIRRGDVFEVDCYYHTSKHTTFGKSSDDEMCLDFLSYYPRQPLKDGGACKLKFKSELRFRETSMGKFLGFTELDGEEQIGRTFGMPCPWKRQQKTSQARLEALQRLATVGQAGDSRAGAHTMVEGGTSVREPEESRAADWFDAALLGLGVVLGAGAMLWGRGRAGVKDKAEAEGAEVDLLLEEEVELELSSPATAPTRLEVR